MIQSFQDPWLDLPRALRRLEHLKSWEQGSRADMRVNLQPIRQLLHALGNPQLAYRIVHVTGTKGKGSVCSLIEAGLLAAGLAAGRFSSPDIERINERFSVLGAPANDADIAGALNKVLDVADRLASAFLPDYQATRFDVMTAAAFVLFQNAGLEWVVVEVGLGGRVDSTNVVFPAATLITNVELEHTEVLGDTRAKIAYEKAGILKPRVPVITPLPVGDEAGAVIHRRAAEMMCPLLTYDETTLSTISARNRHLAGLALERLGRDGVTCPSDGSPLSSQLLDEATCRSARLPGRLELFAAVRLEVLNLGVGNVTVVLDGAHVPYALRLVLHELTESRACVGPMVAVVAVAADKDAQGMLAPLVAAAASLVCTELPSGNGREAKDLARHAGRLGAMCQPVADPLDALRTAIAAAHRAGGWVLATGSLALVAALRPHVLAATGGREGP